MNIRKISSSLLAAAALLAASQAAFAQSPSFYQKPSAAAAMSNDAVMRIIVNPDGSVTDIRITRAGAL